MVLHVGHEDDGAQLRGHVAERLDLFRNPQAEHPNHLVDDRGHTGTRRDDHVVRAGVHVLLDDAVRQVIGVRHQRARGARLRMRIADEGAEAIQQLAFDRPKQAPAGRPVRVDERLAAEGGRETLIDADDAAAERCEGSLEHVHRRSALL